MADTPLSRGAYERLKAELDDLETRGRVEIANTIERARELGDLSENADYHAAREDQGRMEARIRQLRALTDKAVIVETVDDDGRVTPGSVVALRSPGEDDVEHFLVGSIEERREDVMVVSPTSPLGSALLGKAAGDRVSYEAPGGVLEFDIVEVGS